MAQRSILWLAGGFAAGFLLMGIPYWLLPYNNQLFPYPDLIPGMIGLAVVTAVLVAASPARLLSCMLLCQCRVQSRWPISRLM